MEWANIDRTKLWKFFIHLSNKRLIISGCTTLYRFHTLIRNKCIDLPANTDAIAAIRKDKTTEGPAVSLATCPTIT